ncbi:hypothetical protein JOB18_040012 [Solea senegalensis]|nr:hypothetical protein JOB18_040012 [Solea senegalensis]
MPAFFEVFEARHSVDHRGRPLPQNLLKPQPSCVLFSSSVEKGKFTIRLLELPDSNVESLHQRALCCRCC